MIKVIAVAVAGVVVAAVAVALRGSDPGVGCPPLQSSRAGRPVVQSDIYLTDRSRGCAACAAEYAASGRFSLSPFLSPVPSLYPNPNRIPNRCVN